MKSVLMKEERENCPECDMQTSCLIREEDEEEEVDEIKNEEAESSSDDFARPNTLIRNDCSGNFNERFVASQQTRRYRRRAVTKNGYTNLHKDHIPLTGMTSAFQDLFTYLVECRWRVVFLLLFSSFVTSWFLFGVLYWVVAFGHGDLKGHEMHDPRKEPCITQMDDFISCFLFSMETQYSSGYGTRSPTTECPEAVFLVGLQSIFGSLLQAAMSGIVFAKFARPKMRSQAVLFSNQAVICLRDRTLCLMFRVGDVRKSRLLGATLHARLLQHRISPEGERLPHYQHTLNLSVDSTGSEVFLLWPLTAVHRIDANSPLYDVSAADLLSATFEIIIILSGTVESMGQDTEARTSYLSSEVIWGHRFRSLVKKTRSGHALDYRRFDQTVAVETPRCSARQYHCWTHNYVLLNKENVLMNSDLRDVGCNQKSGNNQKKNRDESYEQEKINHRSLLSLIDKTSQSCLSAFSGEDLRRASDNYVAYKSPPGKNFSQ